jgi:hypothetical protein
MSFSNTFHGKPAKIVEEMDVVGPSYGSPEDSLSRQEFDHAAKHVKGLLEAVDPESWCRVQMSGWASKDYETGVVKPGACNVTLQSGVSSSLEKERGA